MFYNIERDFCKKPNKYEIHLGGKESKSLDKFQSVLVKGVAIFICSVFPEISILN